MGKILIIIFLEHDFIFIYCFNPIKKIRKGSITKINIEAIRILQSLGIDIFANFMVKPDFGKSDFRAFSKYCLDLSLNFLGFTVMAPLPGTDFYEEFKNKLIINNYDYYDFFHTHLPTTLPLKEFYKEYLSLYKKTKSISNQIAFLKKYPLKEIPSLFKMYFKFIKQLKTIDKGYVN